jgi:hypothetical protein
MESRFGIEVEVLERALGNMKEEGYLGMDSTIEDLEDMAYSCCEGLVWYAKKKLYEWANS